MKTEPEHPSDSRAHSDGSTPFTTKCVGCGSTKGLRYEGVYRTPICTRCLANGMPLPRGRMGLRGEAGSELKALSGEQERKQSEEQARAENADLRTG